MWCSFNPAGAKKATKENEAEKAVQKSLVAVKEVEKAIDVCVGEMFARASDSLIEFLAANEPKSTDDEIPTAVVCCSFAHIQSLKESLETSLKAPIFSIGRDDNNVRTVIDEARNSKHLGVFMIEQLESLSAEFIEKLVYLIKWFDLRHPLVVCLSTDVATFSSMCSLSTLSRLNARIFEMPQPTSIYGRILSTLIEESRQKNLHISGDLLTLLRSRFFGTGFCVQELKRIVRLCVQQNAWEQEKTKDTSDEEEFEEAMEDYWSNLEFLCAWWNQPVHEMHEEVQSGRSRTERISSKDIPKIEAWLELPSVAEDVRKQMRNALLRYEQVVEEKEKQTASAQPATPAAKTGKMTQVEFQKQQEAKRLAQLEQKKSSPELILQAAFKEMVKSLIFPWNQMPNHDRYLISSAAANELLFCDPAGAVENSMLAEENKRMPLALAFRTLQQRQNWKSLKLSDWLKNYEAQMEDKKDATVSFYASVGQLENMGVIKSAGERNKGFASVLHHPTNHVAN